MSQISTKPVRKILFVVTSHDRKGDKPGGFHLSELTHPFKVLHEAGYHLDIVSPRGSARPDPDSMDLDDTTNAWFWNNQQLRQAATDTLRPGEVEADDYIGIFFVGGTAAMWDLPDNVELVPLTARIYERGGVVAAVCHGPAGLVNVKLPDGSFLVQGRNVAGFTNAEERASGMADTVPFLLADRLEARGANHLPADNFQRQVVIDTRLVTGQNPASATGVAEAMVQLLKNAGYEAELTPAMLRDRAGANNARTTGRS